MRIFAITLLVMFFSVETNPATRPETIPVEHTDPNSTTRIALRDIGTMRVKDVQKILGRKLKLKEKIALKVFQWKIKKGWAPAKKSPAKGNKGKTALIFAIVGMVALFIPIVSIIALPAAIIALVVAYDARKEDPSDRQARLALILAWITIALFLIALVAILIILSSGSFWGWG